MPAKPTGELIIAQPSLANESLDPILGPVENKTYLPPLYDYLVGSTKDGGDIDANTGAAYKWESSTDGLVWTFYIREGIKFHNGADMTADDVKYSLERVLSKRAVSSYAAHFRDIIKEVNVLDKYKVAITLKAPTFTLLYDVSNVLGNEGAIVPKSYIQEKGEEYFATHPIGSGPYKLAEQVLGSYILYEAVDKHWAVGVPKYKNIRILAVPEATTREALLKRGGAQIINVNPDRASDVQSQGFNIFNKEGAYVVTITPHQTWADSPLKDKRVRLALSMAIDRAALVKTLLGGRGTVTGTYPAGTMNLGYQPLPPRAYDIKQAKQLLTDAGYPNGFTLNFYTYPLAGVPGATAIAEAIAGYWSQIGVQSKIVQMDYGAFRKIWAEKTLPNPSVSGPVAIGNRLLPHGLYQVLNHSKGVIASTMVPELDSLIEQLAATPDKNKYVELSNQINKFIYDNEFQIALFEAHATYATSKDIAAWDLGKDAYGINLKNLYTR